MKKLKIAATLTALFALSATLALVFVATAGAPNRPPPPSPPPPVQPTPPPAPTCEYTGAGKDGEEGNDDCATTPTPPPPPVLLNCPAGTQEVGRSSTQVACVKTNVQIVVREVEKIVEKPVVKIKKVVKIKRVPIIKWKTRVIYENCPVPGKG